MRRALPLAVLLLLLAGGLAPAGPIGTASACRSAPDEATAPCGYIYPVILISLEGKQATYDLSRGKELTLPAEVVYRFDGLNEGFTAPDPQSPIVITFEFPRKPSWASMRVEPATVNVPITPQYLQPDVSDPNAPTARYEYRAPITIHVGLEGQAVVPDGRDYARLLVFAKSTESGLYKPGFGIKELRVIPEGAIPESQAAAARGGPTPVPFTLPPHASVTRAAHGLTLTLRPPQEAAPWQPAEYVIEAQAETPPARMLATVANATGGIVHNTGWQRTPSGALAFNLTLPEPGEFTVGVLAEASATQGAAWSRMPFALPLSVPAPGAHAIQFPKAYKQESRVIVEEARADPAAPYTHRKDFAFPILEGAQSAKFTLRLLTPGVPLDRAVGTFALTVFDATGNAVMTGTADATTPIRQFELGALPGSGRFVARVEAAAPAGTAYTLATEVAYDKSPVSAPMSTQTSPLPPDAIAHAGYNWSIAAREAPRSWLRWETELTVQARGRDATGVFAREAALVDAEGLPVSRMPHRQGNGPVLADALTFPAPGPYHVAAFVEAPAQFTAPPLEPALLLFKVETLEARQARPELPAGYDARMEGAFGPTPTRQLVAYMPVMIHEGAIAASALLNVGSLVKAGPSILVELVDPAGSVVESATAGPGESAKIELGGRAPGAWGLRVWGTGQGTFSLETGLVYEGPVTVDNPLAPPAPLAGAQWARMSVAAAAVMAALVGGAIFLFLKRR